MSPDLGINESGTSGTKLLQTPNGRDTDHSAAAAMLMLLGPTTPKNFPAPPMRKRPHQCSTHSIGVLSSPTTCSSPMSVAHHRSNSFLPSSESFYNVVPNGNTRSCGTNVNSYHQRSVSAIADHRRTVSYIVDDGKTQIQHQRSLSSQQQQPQQQQLLQQPQQQLLLQQPQQQQLLQLQQQQIELRRPPALPPKVGGSSSIYRSTEMTTPAKNEDNQPSNLPQFSFLQQLVQSSTNHPELLDTLRRHQAEPQPRFNAASRLTPKSVTRSPNVVTRSPSCAASLYTHHQRAVSMLEPMTSYNETSPVTPNGRFVKHIRSSSTLAPMPETPSSRRVIHQRSTSSGLTRVTSNVTPTRHSKTSQQILLHKSTSNLCQNPDGVKPSHHKRSSSTPYEGFVV